jgi:hypothetical protein
LNVRFLDQKFEYLVNTKMDWDPGGKLRLGGAVGVPSLLSKGTVPKSSISGLMCADAETGPT